MLARLDKVVYVLIEVLHHCGVLRLRLIILVFRGSVDCHELLLVLALVDGEHGSSVGLAPSHFAA